MILVGDLYTQQIWQWHINLQDEIFTSELYPRFNNSIEASLFNDDNLDKYKMLQMEHQIRNTFYQTPLHEKERGGGGA